MAHYTRTLYMDTETYSSVNLFTAGVNAYGEAPDAEVMLWAYAFDEGEGEVKVWDRTDPLNSSMPAELAEGLADPRTQQVWQNSYFDRTMLRLTMGIELPIERIHDTMVQALAHGLPGSLDKLCSVMGIAADDAKDKRGKALIQLFCKPRPKNMHIRRATHDTHPVEWSEFIDYAKSDIRAMRALKRKLPKWNYKDDNQLQELTLWQLDQKSNDRGVLMDVELARAALKAVGDNKVLLDAEVFEATGGALASANQRDALLAYILAEYGVELPDMKASTLERRAKDENLPQEVRDLLALRAETATTSTSKYKKLLQVVSHDNRARGLIQFCGAARTGRDAGRLWQPQNLPRPTMKAETIDQGIEALKLGCADLVTDSIPKLASNALRGSIIASPGRKLVVSDLSSIEGVGAAYLAGEDWKLEAYAAIFADPKLPDMYRRTYGRSFNVDPMAVTKNQRQLGKIQELALAYGGGVGAFVTFVMTYRMDLAAVAAAVLPALHPDVYAKALDMWNWRLRKKMTTYGLTQDVFLACEALKALWRDAHPAISTYWPELEDAFKAAINRPGVDFEARKLTFRRDGAWVRMILPSTRSICYPSPEIHKGGIRYQGINQYSRQWGWIKTYGGKIFENATQAFARDIMKANQPAIEAAGYDILIPVHDELITEADDDDLHTEAELSRMLAKRPWFAPDIPLNAAGFEAYRYKKED